MKKFEYKKVVCLYNEDPITKLNELGKEGWELASMEIYNEHGGRYLYMKRELQ